MTRTAGSNGARTAAAIRRAGQRLIYRHGYEAMTLRGLAAEVGIKAASLYNHIQTKQHLLFELIRDHLERLLESTDAALAEAPDRALARLETFVAHHILYHLERKQEVFIANFELRALEAANYAKIIAMRRAYEGKLIAILEAGVAAGEFEIPDVPIAAYAILAMLTGACTWYKPDGRLGKADVVALHTRMVLNGCIGSEGSGAPGRELRSRRRDPDAS